MRINMFASGCVLALSLFMVGPTLGQTASKSTAKSITVYKTPT